MPLNTPRAFTSIFSTHPNPAVDAWFMAGRQRFGDVRMLNRADGVKPIISSLRKGGLLYLLPALMNWMFVKAVWATNADACQAARGTGACWGVIAEKKLVAKRSRNARMATGTPSFTPTSRKTPKRARRWAVWLTNR